MVRSVIAVLAGIVTLTVTSFAIEFALGQALPNSGWGRALTYAYGFLCVAAGGYVTARLAPRLPLKHVSIMGLVQAGLTIPAMFSPEGDHASTWQWIVIATLSLPAALVGGFLHEAEGSAGHAARSRQPDAQLRTSRLS